MFGKPNGASRAVLGRRRRRRGAPLAVKPDHKEAALMKASPSTDEVTRNRHLGSTNAAAKILSEYLKIEAEARSLAAKFEVENDWKDIKFREANMEDRKMI
ncbi:hypothetical protein ZWY2020_014186 [Hordeum vulgare]|nr:hypothetical protein ZWY2020_014186 [Hordeum vulgare]